MNLKIYLKEFDITLFSFLLMVKKIETGIVNCNNNSIKYLIMWILLVLVESSTWLVRMLALWVGLQDASGVRVDDEASLAVDI